MGCLWGCAYLTKIELLGCWSGGAGGGLGVFVSAAVVVGLLLGLHGG